MSRLMMRFSFCLGLDIDRSVCSILSYDLSPTTIDDMTYDYVTTTAMILSKYENSSHGHGMVGRDHTTTDVAVYAQKTDYE